MLLLRGQAKIKQRPAQDSNLESLAPEADALSIRPAGPLAREHGGTSRASNENDDKAKRCGRLCSSLQSCLGSIPRRCKVVFLRLPRFLPEPVPEPPPCQIAAAFAMETWAPAPRCNQPPAARRSKLATDVARTRTRTSRLARAAKKSETPGPARPGQHETEQNAESHSNGKFNMHLQPGF